MTEQNQIPPNGEDLVLDQQLHALKRFTPIIGFENRVLSRVWRPAPMFWLVFVDRLRQIASPGRRWLAAGLASVGSLVSALALYDSLVLERILSRAQSWATSAVGGTTWDGIQGAAFAGMQTAAGYISSIPAASISQSISQWGEVAIGVTLAPVISLVGLYLVMRRPARERVRSHASR